MELNYLQPNGDIDSFRKLLVGHGAVVYYLVVEQHTHWGLYTPMPLYHIYDVAENIPSSYTLSVNLGQEVFGGLYRLVGDHILPSRSPTLPLRVAMELQQKFLPLPILYLDYASKKPRQLNEAEILAIVLANTN